MASEVKGRAVGGAAGRGGARASERERRRGGEVAHLITAESRHVRKSRGLCSRGPLRARGGAGGEGEWTNRLSRSVRPSRGGGTRRGGGMAAAAGPNLRDSVKALGGFGTGCGTSAPGERPEYPVNTDARETPEGRERSRWSGSAHIGRTRGRGS